MLIVFFDTNAISVQHLFTKEMVGVRGPQRRAGAEGLVLHANVRIQGTRKEALNGIDRGMSIERNAGLVLQSHMHSE